MLDAVTAARIELIGCLLGSGCFAEADRDLFGQLSGTCIHHAHRLLAPTRSVLSIAITMIRTPFDACLMPLSCPAALLATCLISTFAGAIALTSLTARTNVQRRFAPQAPTHSARPSDEPRSGPWRQTMRIMALLAEV
jgi:hypothetical protein